jgi:hypothetical protein
LKVYKIREWKEIFEKAEWRKLRNRWWVAIPVKHDGTGFRRLMAMKNGVELFGAWVLIVQVASKCRMPGTLADETGPLTARDIAIKTGAPEKLVVRALSVVTSSEIGWMTVEDYQDDSRPAADDPPATTAAPPPASREARDDSRASRPDSAAATSPGDGRAIVGDPPDDSSRSPGQPYRLHDNTKQDNTDKNTGEAAPPAGLPAGVNSESPAVVAYWRAFHQVPSIRTQEAIVIRATDLEAWERAIKFWEINNYRPESVGKMLDKHDEIVRERRENGAGTGNRAARSGIQEPAGRVRIPKPPDE